MPEGKKLQHIKKQIVNTPAKKKNMIFYKTVKVIVQRKIEMMGLQMIQLLVGRDCEHILLVLPAVRPKRASDRKKKKKNIDANDRNRLRLPH